MYTTEERKLRLIKKVLTVRDEDILKALENTFKVVPEKEEEKIKHSFKDFLGIWTKEEAEEIEKMIEESCETIDPDDWK